ALRVAVNARAGGALTVDAGLLRAVAVDAVQVRAPPPDAAAVDCLAEHAGPAGGRRARDAGAATVVPAADAGVAPQCLAVDAVRALALAQHTGEVGALTGDADLDAGGAVAEDRRPVVARGVEAGPVVGERLDPRAQARVLYVQLRLRRRTGQRALGVDGV